MSARSKFAVVTIAGCFSALVACTAVNAAEITVVAGGGPLPDVLGTLMPMFEKRHWQQGEDQLQGRSCRSPLT